jgi:glycosyltransferase involved in cell wall biosynthesis
MKVLVYFSGKLFEPKGTPLRTRNIVRALVENGIDTYYAGHDAPPELAPDHVLMLKKPLARITQLIGYINKQSIPIVYIQTSAAVWLVPFIYFGTRAAVGVDFHNRIYQEGRFYHNYSKWGTALRETLELWICRLLAFSTGVSMTLRDFYVKVVPNFMVLPVGVDTRLFAPSISPRADLLEWKKDTTLIGYAGNLKWYQGLDTVLKAYQIVAKKCPGKFSFLIISSSEERDQEAFLKENNLDSNVRILGKQPHEDIPALLAAADILTIVRPSDIVTEYAFPSKFPEYAALGKALIASRVSDIATYIQSGENGILVAPEDVEDTARGMEMLRDSAMREKLGAGARELAIREFDLQMLGTKLVEFLQHVPLRK